MKSSNLRTFPQVIPEFSSHRVLSSVPVEEANEGMSTLDDIRDGGYAVTLDCGHTVWSPIDPGKRMHCGACAWKFIEELRRQ